MTRDDTVRAERSHYFDAGISQVVATGLTVGLDAYFKQSRNLIDEGQFGAPIILTAFNYARGQQSGVEMTASYDRGPLSLYANLAWSRAIGKDINSAQSNFSVAELAYIQGSFIYLDHDQTWSGSAGVAYVFDQDGPHPTRVSGDLLYQSGLRASTATIPNGMELPSSHNRECVGDAADHSEGGSPARCAQRRGYAVCDPQRHRRRSRRASVWAKEDVFGGFDGKVLRERGSLDRSPDHGSLEFASDANFVRAPLSVGACEVQGSCRLG